MEMEWENDDLLRDERKSEELNQCSENLSREKKQKKKKKEKKVKKEKKHKKSKKQKRDKKERTDRGADGSLPSSSEKEVDGNIDNLSPKSDAYCSCVHDNNGKKIDVCRPCQIPTDKSLDDDVDNQKANLSREKKQKKKKKEKKVKKEKKHKKSKKQKRDKKERTDRGADGSLPSSSEKEVDGNIDNLSPKSDAYCSCVHDNNGKKIDVCRPCQIPTDKSLDDDVDNQKADFQQMVSLNSNDKCCDGDNPPPASISEIQLVLNKLRPYLSLPAEDEPNLMKRLNDLGVESVNDLKFINFETDLQGMMKVIQCRKLELSLAKDVTMHEIINTHSEIHNDSSSTVEHKRPVLTQPTEALNFTMPQSKESIRKLLESIVLPTGERLYLIKAGSKSVIDWKRSQESKDILIMFEKKFPNVFRNKESNKKYGSHPERHAPPYFPAGETKASLDDKKNWLIDMHELYIKKENINWDMVTRYMDMTYAFQRHMITCCSGSVGQILLKWPFLGKKRYLKNHFYYLTNTEETALNSFYKTIPTMFMFVQAEAEKEQKDNDLKIKLMTIIKNNSNKNAYDEFLTVLLCYMAIMKENAEHIFIVINDTENFCDSLSSKNIHSAPVVYCSGDIWSNPQCYVVVGKECLWSKPLEIQEAIQIMFMSYYVFNINYPIELAGTLQFLQSYMFDIKDESNKIEKCMPKLLILMNNYDNYVNKKWGTESLSGPRQRL